MLHFPAVPSQSELRSQILEILRTVGQVNGCTFTTILTNIPLPVNIIRRRWYVSDAIDSLKADGFTREAFIDGEFRHILKKG